MVRHLLISTELLAQICGRFVRGDDRRQFIVQSNGLPPDHRVVGCKVREPNMVAIEIDSDEFTDESDLPPVTFRAETC